MLSADTVASAIALADWFAGEQLRILERGRHAARRAKRDEVEALLADTPKGITARDVHRARITDTADEAHALLASMEADGELTGKDSKPETGGHITRTFTKRGIETDWQGRDTRDGRGASVTSVTSVTALCVKTETGDLSATSIGSLFSLSLNAGFRIPPSKGARF